jgi:hypothetical protein
MPDFFAALEYQGHIFAAWFVWRTIPFVLYACVSARLTFTRKVLWVSVLLVSLLCLAVLGLYRSDYAVEALGALSYLAVASALVQWLRNLMAARLASKFFVALSAALLFVVAPAIVMPKRFGSATITMGWEAMFAAYSYCVVTSRRQNPGMEECLWFLLVNPVLAYEHRGRELERIDAVRGMARAASGLLVMSAHGTLTAAISTDRLVTPMSLSSVGTPSEYGRFVAYESLFALTIYLAHSGRASFSIGMMRLLGWEIPERYRYPLFATNPLDFWRRWNTYMGGWMRLYVFRPLARWCARRLRLEPKIAIGFALVLTFIFVGLAHDYGFLFAPGAMPAGSGVVQFFGYGILAALWAAFASFETARRFRLAMNGRPVTRYLLACVGWLVLLQLMLIIVASASS